MIAKVLARVILWSVVIAIATAAIYAFVLLPIEAGASIWGLRGSVETYAEVAGSVILLFLVVGWALGRADL